MTEPVNKETRTVGSYLYNAARGFDEFGNALTGGNSRQTWSSRAYEAAVVQHIWYWRPIYRGINALNYLIQIVRGEKPYDHCKDAYLSDPNHTYEND